MDDDFDDCSFYSKPRLKLSTSAGKAGEEDGEGKPTQGLTAAYCSVGVACIALGICTTGVPQFLALWTALAFLIGPFTPLKITGGNCAVGLGGDVELDEDQDEDELSDPNPSKGSKAPLLKKKASADALAGKAANGIASAAAALTASSQGKALAAGDAGKGGWTRGEWDQLRALLVKHPRGTPKRWESIARDLKTKRSTEEVIAATKFMSESRDKDPFAAFAAQFKSAEKEPQASIPSAAPAPGSTDSTTASSSSSSSSSGASKAGAWTEAQDKALLKALKDNAKGDSERWEKVAQAVAGRSKGECQKRLAELRDNLRARKASDGGVVEEDVDGL